MRSACRKNSGFTLIEVMIAVAIVAIVAAIAFPSYREYVVRTNRSAAQSAMLDLANREQQFLLANRSYADKDALLDSGYSLPPEVSDFYAWDVVVDAPEDGPPTFTITLTPIAGGGQASDVELTLDERGVKTPLEKWR